MATAGVITIATVQARVTLQKEMQAGHHGMVDMRTLLVRWNWGVLRPLPTMLRVRMGCGGTLVRRSLSSLRALTDEVWRIVMPSSWCGSNGCTREDLSFRSEMASNLPDGSSG